jgi:aspartokinase-like uncharacterized kinase
MKKEESIVVIKVGGSLFDWPELAKRLQNLIDIRLPRRVVVVPGGGAAADVVRAWDERHRLGDENAHWLALRSLSLTAHFLASVLPAARVIERLGERHTLYRDGLIPIMDMHAFARADDANADALPHHWGVTSDSLAVRVAVQVKASSLLLLKSASFPESDNWLQAAHLGLVDSYFPEALKRARGLKVEAINLRHAPGDACAIDRQALGLFQR